MKEIVPGGLELMKSGFFLIWFLWLIDFCVYDSTEVWLKAFWQQEYYEIPSCVDSLVLNNIWTHTETMLSIKAPIVPLFPIQLLTFPNIVGTWLPWSLKLFICMDVRMNNTKVLYKVRPTDRWWTVEISWAKGNAQKCVTMTKQDFSCLCRTEIPASW